MSNKNEENFGYDVEDIDTLFIDLEDENGNTVSEFKFDSETGEIRPSS